MGWKIREEDWMRKMKGNHKLEVSSMWSQSSIQYVCILERDLCITKEETNLHIFFSFLFVIGGPTYVMFHINIKLCFLCVYIYIYVCYRIKQNVWVAKNALFLSWLGKKERKKREVENKYWHKKIREKKS